jgi:hypothetical protein
MATILDVSSPSLHAFVLNNVQEGSEVRTDAWSGYKGIESMGYKHVVKNLAASGDPAHVVMPRVHLRMLSCRVSIALHPSLIVGGLAFIKGQFVRPILIIISMSLRLDLIVGHRMLVGYSFTVLCSKQ